MPSAIELLEGYGNDVRHDYPVCLYLADGDVFKADKIWFTWDIVDVYDRQAYKLAVNYRPLDLPI